MQDWIRVIRRACSRKFSWHIVGVAIGLAICAIAIWTLARQLRDIELERVIVALRQISPYQIAVACAFVVAEYVTLTFYDYFSLRLIGRREVPYRVAAMASFLSFSIGHNLGVSVVTCAAIRFRIYSAWGLGIIQVGKIAFLTGMTFWLGNAVVLGVGTLCRPDTASAIDHLSPWINRAFGLAGVAFIIGYLVWLLGGPRVIGRADWKITLPDARSTALQIGMGVTDLVAGALALYTLLPAAPYLDASAVLISYASAMILGALSNAPGSVGVFEAGVLVGLPPLPKEDLLAARLIFRLLCFVIPFCLGVPLLAVRECWMTTRGVAAGLDIAAAEDSRPYESIFRKSGRRFSAENATTKRGEGAFPVQPNRNAL